jgi:hypothetical protein
MTRTASFDWRRLDFSRVEDRTLALPFTEEAIWNTKVENC